MSDTTQYPDGPYLVTWRNGDVSSIFDIRRGMAYGREGGYSTDWLLEQGGTLIPLVPATELDAARQRIAELEAEVERMREKPTEPTLDEMALAISERKPFALHGWGQTWSVHYWDNRTVDQPTMSEAIRAAWEVVCKGEA